MRCKKCGREIRMTRAIKSHAKIRGYWYDCKCGYEMLITKEDIEAHDRDKLKYLEKRDG